MKCAPCWGSPHDATYDRDESWVAAERASRRPGQSMLSRARPVDPDVRRQNRDAANMTVNPYTPTSIAAENRGNRGDRTRSLKRASMLYRWMGWIGIIYFCVAYPLGLWSEIRDSPFRLGTTIGMTLMTVVFVCLFATMIRLAPRLQTDLETVYSRARWTGLLVGACGFPILTIPAFYAVRLAGSGRSNTATGDELSVATEAAS